MVRSALFLVAEDAAARFAHGLVHRLGVGVQTLLLLGRHILRHGDCDRDKLVAAAALALQVRDAFAAQTEHAARLRPLGDGELDAAVDGRHLDLGTERRLGERHRHLHEHGVAVALEERVRLDKDRDEQVALLLDNIF